MTFREIAPLVARMAALPFFPSKADDDARISIATVLAACAANIEQAEWTVNRCLKIWDKWEGPHELRAVLCSKFRPADGVEAYSRLPQFSEGIPSEAETTNLQLTGAPAARQLTGDVADKTFPRDATDLLHEVIERRKAASSAPSVTDAEIERIKSQQ